MNSPQSRRCHCGRPQSCWQVGDRHFSSGRERPHRACVEGSSPSSEVINSGSPCGRADRKHQALHRKSEEVCFELSVLWEAEAKVLTEEDSLLAALQLEAQRVQERIPPPTAPAGVGRIACLRGRVAAREGRVAFGARFTLWGRPGDPSAEDQVVGPIPRPCDGRPSVGCRSIRSDGNDGQSVRCCVENNRFNPLGVGGS